MWSFCRNASRMFAFRSFGLCDTFAFTKFVWPCCYFVRCMFVLGNSKLYYGVAFRFFFKFLLLWAPYILFTKWCWGSGVVANNNASEIFSLLLKMFNMWCWVYCSNGFSISNKFLSTILNLYIMLNCFILILCMQYIKFCL